jgi:hypothetical protein
MFKLAVAIACVMSVSTIAHAEEWSLSSEHKHSKSASIRVVEPEGYKVTVGEATDTVPAVMAIANTDAYVVVKMTAPSGRTWEKKVEVRANHQTILRIKHTPPGDAPKAEPSKVKKHIGTVQNTTNKCQKRTYHKFDFMADGAVVRSIELEAGKYQPNVELPAGTYDVRRFDVRQGQWVFAETTSFAVNKDGWVYYYGCN